MELLKSKNFSLACAAINAFLAGHAFYDLNWLWGFVCSFFCYLCWNNYKNADYDG